MSEPVKLWKHGDAYWPVGDENYPEYRAFPAAEFDALTRERDEAVTDAKQVGEWAEGLVDRVKELTADLASARTALAEAKGVLARFASIDVPDGCESGTWVATTKYGNRQVTAHDVRMARDSVARIDALAGKGER